jgi:hypothetical protein
VREPPEGARSDAEAEILRRLANIEFQITSLDESTAFAMRANRDELLEAVDGVFRKSRQLAQVYVAANGRRSVSEIANIVNAKRQNTSAHLKRLAVEGLLLPHIDGNQTLYRKKRLDQTLGITNRLRERFRIDADGRPL